MGAVDSQIDRTAALFGENSRGLAIHAARRLVDGGAPERGHDGRRAQQRGAGPGATPISSSAPLEAILRSKGQRMLILLDEVDQLYRLQPGSVAARNVLFSLGTLSDLAEEATGQFGVLLCGSSSSTFRLVCGATSPHLRARLRRLLRPPRARSRRLPN
jgi:hypothetical protein